MAFLEFIPKGVMFHYTTPAGFQGITSSKKLWFSDVRASNDPREVIFGLGRVRSALEDLLAQHKGDWDVAQLRAILQRTYETIRNTSYFSCCFSPSGDEMPMWKTYGHNGDGISIGFRPRALFDLHGRLTKVTYLREAENGDINEESFRSVLSETLERAARYRTQLTIEQQIGFSAEIVSRCTSIKHSTWNYEREVRCMYSQTDKPATINGRVIPTTLLPGGRELGPFEPMKRDTVNGQVRYFEFSYGKESEGSYDHSGAIEQVIVGPKCSLTVPDVKAILNSEGFRNFEVLQSECSWR